jgi:hypothetical protein
VCLSGALIGSARAVAVQHRATAPSHETHELVIAAALIAPAVSESVSEDMRVQTVDAGVRPSVGDYAGDADGMEDALSP